MLAGLVLGDNIYKYEEYGFPTRKSLEKSVASFCIGEYETINNWDKRIHTWRRGGYKLEISQNIHGDLWAGQTDVSGKEITEETLFGEVTVFDTVKRDAQTVSIAAYQDWGPFLAITLRYAEAVGKRDIPEIKDWKEVLQQTGFVGTHTAEAEWGDSFDNTRFLMDQTLMQEGKKLESLPLYMHYHEGIGWLPYVKEDKLLYLKKEEAGTIHLQLQWDKKEEKYEPTVVYEAEDLPEILRATYKLFARDRKDLTRIMEKFLSE